MVFQSTNHCLQILDQVRVPLSFICCTTAVELSWIYLLLSDLGISLSWPSLLGCDNKSVIALAFNQVFHARTKLFETDYHFIWEHVFIKGLIIEFISFEDQLGDIFTKALCSPRFLNLLSKLAIT